MKFIIQNSLYHVSTKITKKKTLFYMQIVTPFSREALYDYITANLSAILSHVKGKPVEKQGHKVTGLRYAPTMHMMTAGLPGTSNSSTGGMKVHMNLSSAIQENSQELDLEWVQLIIKAKDLGFSIEEIRQFFRLFTGNQVADNPAAPSL